MNDPVRKRPGMYIGDTDHPHQMLWEVISNCVDEHLVGRCQLVEVGFGDDGSIRVRDDGRGIPIEIAENVLTSLHAGPTFDGHYPHSHVGLRGVGLAVINRLSDWLEIEIERDGGHFRQRYRTGIPKGPLERIGDSKRTGTTIAFRPDPTIFQSIEFSFELIRERLFELAALSKGLRFELRGRHSISIDCPEGLAAFLDGSPELRVKNESIEVVARWANEERIDSFVNMTQTREHGSHVDGLLRALEGRRKGLRAAIHVVLVDPTFKGPTRGCLDHAATERAVYELVHAHLTAIR